MQIVTSPPKKIMFKFLFFTYFWSARQQLSFGYHSCSGDVSNIGLSLRAEAKQPDIQLVKSAYFGLECL